MDETRLPITGLPVGRIGLDALVCGAPERAARIASHLQEAELISDKRGYHSYKGQYQGRPLTVLSHGVGAAGAAAAFEELIAAGARRIIRVGTCGGIQAGIDSGQIVIATAAVANTGLVGELVPAGYPAVAAAELVLALQEAARGRDQVYSAGIVLTRDAFYAGVPGPATPDYMLMRRAQVLAVDMETAALFVIGSLRGVQTAAILAVDGSVVAIPENMEDYQPDRPVVREATNRTIVIALDALQAAI
jgi:uridine phosphorylase